MRRRPNRPSPGGQPDLRPTRATLSPIERLSTIADPTRRWGTRRVVRAVAALVAAAVAAAVVVQARAVTDDLGRRVPVAVARTAIPPGRTLGPDDVERVEWPLGLLPHDPAAADPIGRRTTAEILPGEVVTEGRLSTPGATDDRRLVGLPLPPEAVSLTPGDRVELWGTIASPDGRPPPSSVLGEAVVHEVRDEAVTVAIDVADTASVLLYLTSGVIHVVATR